MNAPVSDLLEEAQAAITSLRKADRLSKLKRKDRYSLVAALAGFLKKLDPLLPPSEAPAKER